MKFAILNGSPKAEKSVTLQSIRYLENHFTNCEFSVIHVNAEIRKCEKSDEYMKKLCEQISAADGIIWAFPVYCAHVPSDYKRFIELIFEYDLRGCFSGKYTTVFSTSIHYYDHTAHNYIHGICDDLNMHFIKSLSHEMNDLLREERREELWKFFEIFVDCIQNEIPTMREYKPLSNVQFEYTPDLNSTKIKTDKNLFIITDATDSDHSILKMIEKYRSSIEGNVELFNLNDIDIKGSCRGCCRCGYDNSCAYRDGFKEFYDHIISNADILIFALTMKDRYFSSLFSKYINRSFVYNHVPVLQGKQIGFIISGSISEEKNTRQLIDEMGTTIGLVSDECGESVQLDREIEGFARLSIAYCDKGYIPKENFLAVGGKKIFESEFSKSTNAIFLADYKYFKKNRSAVKAFFHTVKESIVGAVFRNMMKLDQFRGEVHKNMFNHMVSAHQKVVETGEK